MLLKRLTLIVNRKTNDRYRVLYYSYRQFQSHTITNFLWRSNPIKKWRSKRLLKQLNKILTESQMASATFRLEKKKEKKGWARWGKKWRIPLSRRPAEIRTCIIIHPTDSHLAPRLTCSVRPRWTAWACPWWQMEEHGQLRLLATARL